MNGLRNKVSLIGRIGANPEIVTFESGRTLARFSVATNESYKNKEGEWTDNVQWHQCQSWGKTADLIKKIVQKGDEIIVEGRLLNNAYENKEGEKRYSTSIEVNEFLVISKKESVVEKES